MMNYPDDFLNRIICGDCLKIMQDIPNNSIDLILTDPPYNIANKTIIKRSNFRNKSLKAQKDINNNFGSWDEMKDIDFKLFCEKWCLLAGKKVKQNGHFISFFNKERMNYLFEPLKKIGYRYRNILVWHKSNPTPQILKANFCSATEFIIWQTRGEKIGVFNYKVGYCHNVFESEICMGNERSKHPTQKNIKVINWLLRYLSKENDLILDPFLGSGTLAVAAKLLKRNYIGIEINPEYCKIAEERIRQVEAQGEFLI